MVVFRISNLLATMSGKTQKVRRTRDSRSLRNWRDEITADFKDFPVGFLSRFISCTKR